MNRKDSADPVLSVRVPESLQRCLEATAEKADIPVATLARRYLWFGVETRGEVVDTAAEVDAKRDRLKNANKPLILAGGFEKRVRDFFLDKFKSGFEPRALRGIAESFREEAAIYERLIPGHPNGWEIEEGEYVAKVDEELAAALRAAETSDYWEANDPYGRFEGVEEARTEWDLYVTVVQNLVENYTQLNSAVSSTMFPGVDSVPSGLDADDLPPGTEPEDCVRAAIELLRERVDPADVPDRLAEQSDSTEQQVERVSGGPTVEASPDTRQQMQAVAAAADGSAPVAPPADDADSEPTQDVDDMNEIDTDDEDELMQRLDELQTAEIEADPFAGEADE